MKNNYIIMLGILILFSCILLACTKKSEASIPNETTIKEEGEKEDMPKESNNNFMNEDFIAKLDLTTFDGKKFDANTLRENKVNVINIWGTFCGPCTSEMPILSKLSEEYSKKGLKLIGICCDIVDNDGSIDNDQLNYAKEIISDGNIKYDQYLPTKNFIDSFLNTEVQYIPYTIIVGQDGKVLDTMVGSQDEEGWRKIFDKALQ